MACWGLDPKGKQSSFQHPLNKDRGPGTSAGEANQHFPQGFPSASIAEKELDDRPPWPMVRGIWITGKNTLILPLLDPLLDMTKPLTSIIGDPEEIQALLSCYFYHWLLHRLLSLKANYLSHCQTGSPRECSSWARQPPLGPRSHSPWRQFQRPPYAQKAGIGVAMGAPQEVKDGQQIVAKTNNESRAGQKRSKPMSSLET